MAEVDATLVRIRPGQTVTGTVVQVTDDEVCVNIGYKSDGIIKRTELTQQDVKLGDELEVEVVKVNDGEGNVLLSRAQHRQPQGLGCADGQVRGRRVCRRRWQGGCQGRPDR